jgi:Helix-turn-helix domain
MQPDFDDLGNDLLVSVDQIAAYLKQPRRRVQHWVDRRLIPCSKTGNSWTALKSELRKHFAGEKADAA